MTASQPAQRLSSDAQLLEERLRELIDSNRIDLPLLPDTAVAALRACRSEKTSPMELSDLLHRDPALAGHVLRLANSAAYGGLTPIVSLTQAIQRLGRNMVAELITVVAIHGRIYRNRRFETTMRDLWSEACLSGAWGREVARTVRLNTEGAFLCGLLHNVGMPVLYYSITQVEDDLGIAWEPSVVHEVVDQLSSEVGARLLTLWSMPEWVIEAARHANQWSLATEHRPFVLVTVLSDRLAAGLPDADIPPALLQELELYADDLARLHELEEDVRQHAAALA